MSAPVSMVRAFALFAFAYCLSYALRAVNAAIGPEVAQEFNLDAAFLGGMTAAYLAAFAATQIPLGRWLDRYGPVRTECVLLLIAAAGCAVFALATSTVWLVLGRALIGAGVAACLMAPFKAYRIWFAPNRQGQLASWMLLAGTLGAMLAASPAQWAVQWLGWRGLFAACALALAVSAFALWIGLPRGVPAQAAQGAAIRMRSVLRAPAVRNFAPNAVFGAGGFIALQTLWLGPWMRNVYGMTPDQAAAALTGMNAAMLAGFLAMGSAAPWLAARAKWLSVVINGAFTLTGVLILAVAVGGAALPWFVWALVGLSFTVQPMAQSRVTLAFAPEHAGRVSTTTNLLIFGGAFVLQWGVGAAINALTAQGFTTALAMRWVFGALGVAIAASGLWGWWTAAKAYKHQ
jgi:predicted MFS family arabinose efflux permease